MDPEIDPDKLPLSKPSKPPKAKVIVWFDRARDCLCIADRMDEEKKINGQTYKYEEGAYIPEPFIVKIPLMYGEDFIQAIFNAANAGSDFCKVMDGIQRLLDGRASTAIDLTEQLRSELAKRSGGGVVANSQKYVQVGADRWQKLWQLQKKVWELLEQKDLEFDGGGVALMRLQDLSNWMQSKGLYEPGQLPPSEERQYEGQS